MENQAQAPQGSGCFKKGCMGCGGAVAFLALLVVGFGLVALINRPGPEDFQSEELTQPLPALPGPVSSSAEAPSQAEASPRAGTLESQELGRSLGAEPVRLVLRLSKGSFTITPAPAGSPLKVEADYDAERFVLEQHWDAADRRYDVRFDAKGGLLSISGNRRSRERVNILVPRDYPLIVEGKISMGESRLELGGLAVEEVDLDLGMGDHLVTFGERTSVPMQRFSVDGSMGELGITDLGNASPRQSRISLSMGELDANLAGAWRQDAAIDVRCGMGECEVRTPNNVKVVVERASVGIGESWSRGRGEPRELPPGTPTLTVRASGSIGTIKIH